MTPPAEPLGQFEVALGGERFDPVERRVIPTATRDDEPGDVTQWIVQMHRPLLLHEQEGLREHFHLALTDFVPRLSYIEELTAQRANDLAQDALVRAVAPLDAAARLHPSGRAAPVRDDDAPTIALVAQLTREADVTATVAAIVDAGALSPTTSTSRAGGPAVVSFFARPAAVARIAATRGVRWVEPAPVVVDDEPSETAAMVFRPPPLMGDLPEGLDGRGELIGIIDNGRIDLAHTFFADPLVAEPGPGHRKVAVLRDATGSAAAPGLHATFVAGCAAGDDAHTPGSARWRGAAPAARLVLGNRNDLATFSTTPGGPGRSLGEELAAAALAGALVHSHSFHAIPPDPTSPALYDVLSADVDRFVWESQDALVLGSAGNTDETQGPPGTAKNALCVGAATADQPDARLGDAALGPTVDGRTKPDLLVTACGVQSAIAGTSDGVGPRSQCASSYATPFAAAAAVLVRQYLRGGWHPTGRPASGPPIEPTGALVKAVLIDGTEPIADGQPYPSPMSGFGLLRLRHALPLEGDARTLHLIDVRHAHGLTTGTEATHDVEVVDDTEPLSATLAWYDPPGVPGAEDPVVNDLDLEVTAPDGRVLLGNAFADTFSAPGRARDARNTVERVRVDRPQPGRWRLVVRATAVNVGAPGQGFALVISGALAR